MMTNHPLYNKDRIDRDIAEYLHQQEQKDILRLITCGSVDDGKSTLIGRILHDTKMIFDDQLLALEKDSKLAGTTGTKADLALLVDGLQSEREQGITIDVAYRYFTTDKRKFIIADTPGHEQYTRNMATGASAAQLAVLLVDARYGIQQQTRRHSYICSLLGIRHFIVAVNKMDLVNYNQQVFEEIQADFCGFAKNLEIPDIQFVPLSALTGDNVVSSSNNMPWYSGEALMSILENVPVNAKQNSDSLRLPIQYVNRPHLNFRGYCGTLASGIVVPGQPVKVLPSGKTTIVDTVLCGDQTVDSARSGEAITITLKNEIDISRGDLIVGENEQLQVSNEFDANIVWMHETELAPGRRYDFKIGTAYASGTVAAIASQVDINTLERTETDKLALNGIGEVRIRLTQEVVYDLYEQNSVTGSFIIIDRLTNLTVGAGMISRPVSPQGIDNAANDELHFADNLEGTVTPQMRAAIKPHAGKCIWFGTADSGESLEYALHQRGVHTWLLDGALFNSDIIPALVKSMLEAGLVVIVINAGTTPDKVEEYLLKHQLVKPDSTELTPETIEFIHLLCKF